MRVSKLALPRRTTYVVVDPLDDFVHPEEPFVRAFGPEDVQPVIDCVERLKAMVAAWHDQATLLLCESHYQEKQWPEHGLEKLCTTSLGRMPVIDRDLFDGTMIKTHNSLLWGSSFDLNKFLGSDPFFGVAGLTITSCVKATIQDCREYFRGSGLQRQIIVALNSVGARKSQTEKAQTFIEEWSHPDTKDVIVVPEWEAISYVKGAAPATIEA